eukprot:TRINITY_DN7435_c0_g1_i7.p1 TRINITY_DN7435_c0_g1~~TRINITY_DN7435_c0_g1_i7.p1  ORF type:complete len:454 (+),score=118.32 TRINITY_DN7435_c0_g1_i7:57-1418(+)
MTEKRIDPANGKWYTEAEFVAHYKGTTEWVRAALKRMDPADGKMYTEAEFTAHYKGTAEWEKAAKEHRIDEADGKAYTEEEFVRHYWSREQWERARPIATADTEEKRRSADGLYYTKAEFLEYHGQSKGLMFWNKAGGKECAKDGNHADSDTDVGDDKQPQGWCDRSEASKSAKSAKDSDSDSGDEDGDEGGDKKPPPSSPSKEDELKKLTSQQRAVYEKAHSKETKYPSKKHCYLVYSSEQALLWELRAWLAGVCLRFDPNKAVFPALTDEWHCTTDLLEAVKHLKPEHATLPAFVTRTHAPAAAPSELLKACNLTGHEANIMNLATKLKVATPGLLQITLSPDVATELVEDEDGTNQTLAVRRGALLIDKKRVWLTPYPLSGSRARVEFQSNLTQTVLLHGHAKPLRAGLRATHPTLFSMGLHGHHTVYQDIVKALLGYVPRWFDEAKCAR